MQQPILLKASACRDRLRKGLIERTRWTYSYVKIKIAIAKKWLTIAEPEFIEWFTEYFEKKTFATRSRYPTIYKVVHIFFAVSIIFVFIQVMTWFYKIVPPLVNDTYQSAIIDRAVPESASCQVKK